ncbi:MAG: LysR family transcriptional regulator [Proteobacteria bacterium]|nr:LysR family transcriptional regulator [Pseudomonadota bacterium]
MQHLDWDQLRFLLAVARTASFSGAARHLGVDATTVARRLRALQDRLSAALISRDEDGTLRLTPVGRTVAEHAERIEGEVLGIGDATGRGSGPVLGTVRLTAVPILANRLIVPRLPGFLAANPGLSIELVAAPRNLNITRRDADLALRFARPSGGGEGLWTRALGKVAYGIFGAAGQRPDGAFITYGEDWSHLPQARWLEARIRAGDHRAPLRVSDAETALEAAAAGIGLTLLPRAIAAADARLAEHGHGSDLPAREVWIIGHRDQRGLARTRAVVTFLAGVVAAQAG